MTGCEEDGTSLVLRDDRHFRVIPDSLAAMLSPGKKASRDKAVSLSKCDRPSPAAGAGMAARTLADLLLGLNGGAHTRRRRHRHPHAAVTEIDRGFRTRGQTRRAHERTEEAVAETDRLPTRPITTRRQCNENRLKPSVWCRQHRPFSLCNVEKIADERPLAMPPRARRASINVLSSSGSSIGVRQIAMTTHSIVRLRRQ